MWRAIEQIKMCRVCKIAVSAHCTLTTELTQQEYPSSVETRSKLDKVLGVK